VRLGVGSGTSLIPAMQEVSAVAEADDETRAELAREQGQAGIEGVPGAVETRGTRDAASDAPPGAGEGPVDPDDREAATGITHGAGTTSGPGSSVENPPSGATTGLAGGGPGTAGGTRGPASDAESGEAPEERDAG
jgi:hypothetical protein